MADEKAAPKAPEAPKVDPMSVLVHEIEKITGVTLKETRKALGMK